MQSAQQALSDGDASRTVKKVEISPKQFKDFKSFLNIIKSEFNDFSMVDGAFRSYCNDRWRKCLVETGFPFFTDISFTVCNIKTFLKSISTHGEKFPVNVTVTESKITFEDLYGGNIEFLTANPEHSDIYAAVRLGHLKFAKIHLRLIPGFGLKTHVGHFVIPLFDSVNFSLDDFVAADEPHVR